MRQRCGQRCHLLPGEDGPPPEEGFVARIVEEAAETSTRGFLAFLDAEFRRERRETLVLKEYLLDKFDRLRRKYGDETLSIVDLIETLLEKELKAPGGGALYRGG